MEENNAKPERSNYEIVRDTVKYSGFGNHFDARLMENIGKPKFDLDHTVNNKNDKVKADLFFSTSTKGNTFFNKFDVELTKENGEVLKRTFYINGNKPDFTFKEGYNLLNGRYVENQKKTKEGKIYTTWDRLDLTSKDKYGNYPVVSFGSGHGFDLEKCFKELPIILVNEYDSKAKLDALRRGNYELGTFTFNELPVEGFMKAEVELRRIDVFNEHGDRYNFKLGILEKKEEQNKGISTASEEKGTSISDKVQGNNIASDETKGAQVSEKNQGTKNTKKENNSLADDGEPVKKKRNSRKGLSA